MPPWSLRWDLAFGRVTAGHSPSLQDGHPPHSRPPGPGFWETRLRQDEPRVLLTPVGRGADSLGCVWQGSQARREKKAAAIPSSMQGWWLHAWVAGVINLHISSCLN